MAVVESNNKQADETQTNVRNIDSFDELIEKFQYRLTQ